MRSRSAILILILVLLLFHGLNNYIILTKSRYCLGLDSIAYIERTIQTSQALREVRLNLNSFYKTYYQIFVGWRPPLFYFIASPFLLFGIDKNIIIMSHLISFAILLFATYGIGKALYNSKVGILSAILVSMFPIVFAVSRILMLDFTLTAMVALTFYLFVLNKFNSIKFSLLTGIVIGLGALSKNAYFVFLLPMLIYFFLQKNNLKSKKILRNFSFSIIVGLLISASYYVHHSNFETYYDVFLYKDTKGPFFYLYSLPNHELLLIFFCLFIISLVFYFRRKDYFLPVMVLTLLISFSIIRHKEDRYILPIFPYIAVMISNFVRSLSKTRKMLSIILVLFSFLQYFIISYGNNIASKPAGVPHKHSKNFLLSFNQKGISRSGLFSKIDEGDWQNPCEEIIRIINDKYRKMNKRINVLFIGQENNIYTTINYLVLVKKLPIYCQYAEISGAFLFPEGIKFIIDYDNRVTQSDFIIIEKVSPKDMWISTSRLLKAFEQNFDKFNFVKTIPFPNKFVMLYIRK